MERLMPRQCPQCEYAPRLYRVIMNANNEAVAVECCECNARFPVNVPRNLTIEQAGWLADLIHGVQFGLKMRYFPLGVESGDNPMEVTLRAFTYEGGGMYPHDADIRDAFVHCSSAFEHWLKVDVLILALDNLSGKHGLNRPMAIIDKE